jgi:hypothetical protein
VDDWQRLAIRTVALSQIGGRIEHDSGHRWLFWDEEADYYPRGIEAMVRDKQYGSYAAVLDAVDVGLERLGRPVLIQVYAGILEAETDDLLFGEGTQ